MCDFQKDCLSGDDEKLCDNYFSSILTKDTVRKRPPVIIHFDGRGDFIDTSINQDDIPEEVVVDLVEDQNTTKRHGALNYRQSNSKPERIAKSCPETHFWCSKERLYCLPVYVRCNGVRDCTRGEDELDCEDYLCPGYYRWVIV